MIVCFLFLFFTFSFSLNKYYLFQGAVVVLCHCEWLIYVIQSRIWWWAVTCTSFMLPRKAWQNRWTPQCYSGSVSKGEKAGNKGNNFNLGHFRFKLLIYFVCWFTSPEFVVWSNEHYSVRFEHIAFSAWSIIAPRTSHVPINLDVPRWSRLPLPRDLCQELFLAFPENGAKLQLCLNRRLKP